MGKMAKERHQQTDQANTLISLDGALAFCWGHGLRVSSWTTQVSCRLHEAFTTAGDNGKTSHAIPPSRGPHRPNEPVRCWTGWCIGESGRVIKWKREKGKGKNVGGRGREKDSMKQCSIVNDR